MVTYPSSKITQCCFSFMMRRVLITLCHNVWKSGDKKMLKRWSLGPFIYFKIWIWQFRVFVVHVFLLNLRCAWDFKVSFSVTFRKHLRLVYFNLTFLGLNTTLNLGQLKFLFSLSFDWGVTNPSSDILFLSKCIFSESQPEQKLSWHKKISDVKHNVQLSFG